MSPLQVLEGETEGIGAAELLSRLCTDPPNPGEGVFPGGVTRISV